MLCKWSVIMLLKLKQCQLREKEIIDPTDRETKADLLLVESIMALLNKKRKSNATKL